MRGLWWPAALALTLAATHSAVADPSCRAVEIRFAPGAPGMQIAVWIEDAQGRYVDTAYVTRLTGQFGLGNRPGTPLLKTDFRWPYGRREMVLPVWAHRRDHHYPKVVMGGVCGNSPMAKCPDGGLCSGDCVDSTIAYHSKVSSYEPFYCSPTGASRIDALSCASKGTFSKGAYAAKPDFSLYPPRADLTTISPQSDSPDAHDFAIQNDLVAISQATPVDGVPIDPPATWYPANNLTDGEYVAWVEMSMESDFNAQNDFPNQSDTVSTWDFEGHKFLGQPSVVYRVPFHLGDAAPASVTASYAGYGAWDGSDGDLRPPDATISDQPGTGAGRLLDIADNGAVYRTKVTVERCLQCVAPDPVTALAVAPSATSIDVSFLTPAAGVPPNRYSVRYREGSAPITDDDFNMALAAEDPAMVSAPGAAAKSKITGLIPSTSYAVAVRGLACGHPATVMSTTVVTAAQQFVTLNGCFVATAAYGTPMAGSVALLRRFRDTRLLDNAAGRLGVAGYYAFSPSLAAAIAGDRRLRAAARSLLAPLVELVKEMERGN